MSLPFVSTYSFSSTINAIIKATVVNAQYLAMLVPATCRFFASLRPSNLKCVRGVRISRCQHSKPALCSTNCAAVCSCIRISKVHCSEKTWRCIRRLRWPRVPATKVSQPTDACRAAGLQERAQLTRRDWRSTVQQVFCSALSIQTQLSRPTRSFGHRKRRKRESRGEPTGQQPACIALVESSEICCARCASRITPSSRHNNAMIFRTRRASPQL